MSLTLPDGKIVYNLLEQVAKNAADIKKIAAVLDGLNIQDNVVAIADISQILTRAELDIVEKPVAFLYYSDQLYIKRNEVGGSAFFDVIFSISGSTVISFTSKVIEVVLTTGALILTTSTYSTYSKTELDTKFGLKADTTYVDGQLALKANLSGANFSGAITSPSIIETMSGYSYITMSKENITINPDYVGAVKNGNKLTLVWFGRITRTGDVQDGWFTLGRIGLPSAVANKLITHAITGLSNSIDDRRIDCFSSQSSSVSIIGHVSRYENNVSFVLFGTSSLVLNTEYTLRYETTFLLSDSLI